MARVERPVSEFEERLVQVNRVAKVVKGGRRFNFSSVVVVGDGHGTVGVGTGKASEVPDSIRKAGEDARKHMVRVPLVGSTIPHEITVSYGASKVLLKPASPGTGVIAGSGVRAVVEAAGIKDILTKSLGNNNPINTTRATLLALSQLSSIDTEAQRRGLPADEMERRHYRKDVAVQKALKEGRMEARPSTGREPGSSAHQVVGRAPVQEERGRGDRRGDRRGGGGDRGRR
jgi:small subunit ribosomal protein S5